MEPTPLDDLAVRMTEPLLEARGTYGTVIVSDGTDDVVRGNVATDDDLANLLARAIVELDLVAEVVLHLRGRYERSDPTRRTRSPRSAGSSTSSTPT